MVLPHQWAFRHIDSGHGTVMFMQCFISGTRKLAAGFGSVGIFGGPGAVHTAAVVLVEKFSRIPVR
jgi:hypothetical protein